MASDTVSDDDDLCLFHSNSNPVLARTILSLNHNQVTSFDVNQERFRDLDEPAWNRLKDILGRNTSLTELKFHESDGDHVSRLCASLSSNRSIKKFTLDQINLIGTTVMSSASAFVTSTPSLLVLRHSLTKS